jgi:hypothetical protein
VAPEWSDTEPLTPDPRPRSFGSPLDYAATAIRPAYTSVPESVRSAIAAELGGDPIEVAMAGGSFTTGFAARLRAASGATLFVKAAGPGTPEVRESVHAEARFNAALPTGVPSPALRFHSEVDGWAVTGFEAVPAKPVTLPMTPRTLDLMLRAWAEAAEALSPPTPELIAAGVRVKNTRNLRWFRAVAGGELTAFELPQSLRGHWDELADIETSIERVLGSRQVSHADLRPDNMIVSEDRAWVCDWAKPRYMPHWLDTAILLSVAHGDGHDAEHLFWTHPTARGVAEEELDAVLAAVAGALLQGWPNAPSRIVAPAIQTHMRWAGLATADWLAQRRGW